MKRRTIGIVDYGVGNHTSVWRSLHELGYRCRISHDPEVLDGTRLLVLPGVGAFPSAMSALHARGLVPYLTERARSGHPIIGICLGMQLLCEASHENGLTAGIALIPGQIVPLAQPRWHIGWNTIDVTRPDPIFSRSDGQSFYFNHSYIYQGPPEYAVAVTRVGPSFPSIIRKANTVGIQFHPEKSQAAGRQLLHDVIEGLCNA